jgi:hypothetical protein
MFIFKAEMAVGRPFMAKSCICTFQTKSCAARALPAASFRAQYGGEFHQYTCQRNPNRIGSPRIER